MEVYYQLVTEAADLQAVCQEAAVLQAVGLDTETTELDPYKGELRLIQIATSPTTVKIIDLRKFPDPKKNPDLDCLRDLFFAPRPTKVLHNAKFDAKWLKLHVGAELGGIFDTLLGSQILAAGETDRRHNLADVTYEFVGEELDKSEQVSNWSADELSPSQLEYAAKDAGIVLRIREKMIERLKAENLIEVAKLEFDCVEPIAYMELAGIFLDRERWSEQLKKVKKVQTVVADELQEMLSVGALQGSLFGRTEINLDSHTQLTEALTRLGVPLPATTRNWQLEPLANDYPVVKKLLEYRSIQKAITSYGENILEYINPKTGRIHADFRQIGAPTGRMSCNNPNVQQVPHGEEYRRCFRAPEGRKFIISDYCVAKGTRVATKRGLIPIEEMTLDDAVFLEDGSITPISAVIERGKLPVVKVTLKNGYSLIATALHRVRVLDLAGNYVWRRIGEIKHFDSVAIQSARGIAQENTKIKLPAAEFSHFNNIAFECPKFVNTDLALFAGYVCGDGHLARNAVKWVVNQQDKDVAKLIDETATKLFGLEIHWRKPYRGIFESGLYSTPLVQWLNEIGVAKDRVPEFIWRSNSPIVCAFLRGLFEADGSVTNTETGKVSFASSRRRLAFEVHQLLLALGIPATLRKQEGVGNEKEFSCWTVSIVAGGLLAFAEKINFISHRKQGKLNGILSRWTGKAVIGNMPNLQSKVRALNLSGEARRLLNNVSTFDRPISSLLAQTIKSDFPQVAQILNLERITDYKQLFLPVVSIEDAGETEVFDLSVPGAMTYISDGFVSHNSQIELRILADFTDDKGFVNAFNSGADLHREAAAQIFNVAPEAVTSDQRSFAKRINFGVVYGIGAQRVSNLTGISLNEAQDLLRKYFATYRKLDAWLREAASKATKERQARTVSGRLARFRFDADDRQSMSLAERNGKNTPIQGCVIGETRIFERSCGYVPIKILVDREISVWDGQRFSKATVAYSGEKQLVDVEFWGGYSIQCSPEHKFLTIDVNGRRKWRTPGELIKGNYVVLTEAIGQWAVDLDLPEFQAGKSWNANRISLSEGASEPSKFGEWLGRLASDGILSGHQTYLLVAQHEESILPQIMSFTAKFGHVTYQTRTGGRGTQLLHFLTLSSLGLTKQLVSSGLKSRIPDFVWRDSQILAGYLRGMFDGDGTVNPDGAVLTFGKGSAFYLTWAREIQQALLLFGVRSRVNRCADRINVCVLKRDMSLFCRQIGFINLLKQAKAETIEPQTNYENKIYGRAARIKKVEFTDEWVDMYDVVNSETGRFMANGMVTHNSSADILKRALRLLHNELRDTSACIVNVIHDEIVVEVDAHEAEAISKKVEKGMCDAGEEYVKRVPVKVESVIADEWLK